MDCLDVENLLESIDLFLVTLNLIYGLVFIWVGGIDFSCHVQKCIKKKQK